jgi:hypothetical protein
MILSEIFDNSYTLRTNERTDDLRSKLRDEYPYIRTMLVYQSAEDPDQFFLLTRIDGEWEVHHFLDTGAQYSTGVAHGIHDKPNPRWISTAIKLYRARLDKGNPIRIIAGAASGMWPLYQRVIQKMIDNSNGGLIADTPDHNYKTVGGEAAIAQTIKPAGKTWIQEALNKNVG